MAKFAVIGLGKMGSEAAITLARQGAEVIAIDTKRELVERIKDRVSATVVLDGTDIEALREMRIDDVDAAIVTMGDSIEASILCTLVLKDMGIPHVVARAISDPHEQVLKKVGASLVVQPEREMGRRLAHIAMNRSVYDYIQVTGGLGIAEIEASEDMVGKTLAEIDFRKRYKAMVLAIRRGAPASATDGDLVSLPQADARIEAGDHLVLTAQEDDLKKIGAGSR